MAETEIKDPETILKKTERPALTGTLFLSVLVHAALIALTSFGLFRAWSVWGVHTPAEIKRLEKEAAKEAAQAEAKAKAEAAEQAAGEQKADAKGDAAKPEAAKPAAEAAKPAPAAAPAAKTDGGAKALPLDKEVAKPPKSFDLNDIDL